MDKLLVQAEPKAQTGVCFVKSISGKQEFIERLTPETLKKPIKVIKATRTLANGKSEKCGVDEAMKHFLASGTINIYVDANTYVRQA